MARINEVGQGISEYLSLKWDLLLTTGRQPSCGRTKYIRRNAPYVRRNIADDPEYLDKRYRKIELLKTGFVK